MITFLRDMLLYGAFIGMFLISMAVLSQANERQVTCEYVFPEVEMKL